MKVTQISSKSFLRHKAPFDNHLSVPSTNSYRAVIAFRQLSLHQGQRKTKLIITYLYHISKERSKNIFCSVFLKIRSDQRNFSEIYQVIGQTQRHQALDLVVLQCSTWTAPKVFHFKFWQSTSCTKLRKKLTQKIHSKTQFTDLTQ